MKQFLIAFAVLLAACSSTRHDADLSTHADPVQARSRDAATSEATLQPDEFDAAAAISIAEAAKAAGGADVMNHADHDHAARGEETATIYACPMHPEVTSATPGKCPKCGMTLVERNKK